MNYSNNGYSVLNGSITNVATAITVATGTGSRFPASDFRVTLIGYDGSGNENAWEICHCTSRTGDVLTVTRGQEGTAAVAWANASRIEHRVTAAQVAGLLEKAGGDMTGNLGFSGVGRRILGLLSSTTALIDRLFFQSSTTNGSTDITAIPNGTSTRAGWGAINSSDTTNHSFFSLLALVADMRLWSGKSGTGTVLPMTFYTDNSERMRIDAVGTVSVAARAINAPLTDNDLSFDLSARNNFGCTPTGAGTLTFTNVAAGQSGFIRLTNNSNYTISAAATTKIGSTTLATISVTGTYLLSYFSEDGVNVYVVNSGALA